MFFSASASAKTILFGEHAVVYGEPAIAIPLPEIRTTVHYLQEPSQSFDLVIHSAAYSCPLKLSELPNGSGIAALFHLLKKVGVINSDPVGKLEIQSDIPIASGLGSGAALSIALIRCILKAFGKTASADQINQWAYEIEKIYHGTPSGIDNTVICYEVPLIFQKGQAPQLIRGDQSRLPLLVVDSGIRSETKKVVEAVRDAYPNNAGIIRAIGSLTKEAIPEIKKGNLQEIGRMMNENQLLLRSLGVSCSELDSMTATALENGAVGAKLTGAGAGGNFLVLAPDYEKMNSLKVIFESKGYKVFL